MAFDGTLKFDTSIDKSGFEAGVSSLSSAAEKGMALIGDAVKAATAKLAELGKSAVSVGMNFESGMAQVMATMGVTKDTVQDGVNSYELLKQAAADAGASTTFSATEAAGALNYLALAGYSAAQAADALPAVLDLAAAGGMNLQYASDLATDAMAALGIEANKDNLTHFGDQLAKTASRANASVSQLGEAILTVGGTANQLAGDTDELNAVLGVLANRGIKGAEGGTHLRNMILSLSAPTSTAAAKLAELGVSAKDADGKLRPLNEVFADLAKSGATVEDLNEIFNKTDLSSAQAMMAGCGEEFDNLISEIKDCNDAMEQMAKTMNDTLEGDMKSLSSKAESLGIAIYDSLNAPLRDLAQTGISYLSQLTDAFQTGGFEGLASAFGDVLGQAAEKLSSYLPKVIEMAGKVVVSFIHGLSENAPQILNTAVEIIKSLMAGIAHGGAQMMQAGAELMHTLWFTINQNLPSLIQLGGLMLRELGNALLTNLPLIVDSAVQIVKELGLALAANAEKIVEGATALISTLVTVLLQPSQLNLMISVAIRIVEALVKAISNNLSQLVNAAVRIITVLSETLLEPGFLIRLIRAGIELLKAVAQAIVDNLPLLIHTAVELISALVNDLLKPDNILKLMEAGIEILCALVDAIVDNLDEVLMAAERIITTLWDELMKPETIEKLMTLGGKLLAKLIEGLGQIGGKLLGFATDLFDEAWNELLSIDWASLGVEILEGICSGLFDCDFKLSEFFGDFKDNWVTGIKGAFGIASPSKVMREQVGRYLAEGVGVGFADYMPEVEPEAVSLVSRLKTTATNIQPSPTGTAINNNYAAAAPAAGTSGRPQYTIHAVFQVDGQRFAEYAAERVDLLQGEAVTMDERGTAF